MWVYLKGPTCIRSSTFKPDKVKVLIQYRGMLKVLLQLEQRLIQIHDYQNMLFTPALLQPRSILHSLLVSYSHTSNLMKPQLCPCHSAPCCVLFHHLLSCDSLVFSLTLCSHCIFPLSLHLYLVVLSPAMASGSTLTHPSARVQTNQCRVVLSHKDQKQLVSSVCLASFSCAWAASSVTQVFAHTH